jgi:hypothetical protein
MMYSGHIRIYSGPQPETADHPATGTLLGWVSQDGITPIPFQEDGGLHLTQGHVAGSLVKDGVWVLTGAAEGTPGWWRFQWGGEDDGGETTYLPRIDGAVGESLQLGIATITPTTKQNIQSFQLIFPAQ